jgi:hypothetical protein
MHEYEQHERSRSDVGTGGQTRPTQIFWLEHRSRERTCIWHIYCKKKKVTQPYKKGRKRRKFSWKQWKTHHLAKYGHKNSLHPRCPRLSGTQGKRVQKSRMFNLRKKSTTWHKEGKNHNLNCVKKKTQLRSGSQVLWGGSSSNHKVANLRFGSNHGSNHQV